VISTKIVLGGESMKEQPISLDSLLRASLEGPQLDLERIIISLLLGFILSRIVIFVYYQIVKDPLPPQQVSYNITLIALITTLVIMPITTNVVLSLGMVGALSVIRFRTAMKSPVDTSFVYWAVAIGIALGAGFFLAAILGTVLISLFMILTMFLSSAYKEKYIVNVQFELDKEEVIMEQITKDFRLLSRVQRDNIVFLTYEIKDAGNISIVKQLPDIQQSEVVSFSGDYVR
jgi:hypothetical protein